MKRREQTAGAHLRESQLTTSAGTGDEPGDPVHCNGARSTGVPRQVPEQAAGANVPHTERAVNAAADQTLPVITQRDAADSNGLCIEALEQSPRPNLP